MGEAKECLAYLLHIAYDAVAMLKPTEFTC